MHLAPYCCPPKLLIALGWCCQPRRFQVPVKKKNGAQTWGRGRRGRGGGDAGGRCITQSLCRLQCSRRSRSSTLRRAQDVAGISFLSSSNMRGSEMGSWIKMKWQHTWPGGWRL